jgi:hypothetical protein
MMGSTQESATHKMDPDTLETFLLDKDLWKHYMKHVINELKVAHFNGVLDDDEDEIDDEVWCVLQ